MAVAATAVVTAGTVAGVLAAVPGGGGRDSARPEVTSSPEVRPLPARPSPAPSSARPSKSRKAASPSPHAVRPASSAATVISGPLYRHFDSQVLDWVGSHRDDPRRPLIESRIAARPAAVWFPQYDPGQVRARVRAVTSRAAAQGRVPVLVPYAIPERDCGGASEGGAPDLAAYDRWMREFAAGLGGGPSIVILEPDAIAQSDCLTAGRRTARFASLARAGRAVHAAAPKAKIYFDGGNSDWNPPAQQAAELRAAGAAASGDGIFTNVSNFNSTADEAAYARRVLAALGGPARLGAVIDTSRNGNGAAAGGAWCDPAGRAIGQAPTTRTGQARIDAYLWVKLPGESDGCKGAAGTFVPEYAYELAGG
ncbi:glycoside hydrolase family 6 protein [Streptomyces beijiangensis]|uniref:Glucanase n=1 Tax=Streptomyces beijiangensis TaxID=163361 RepID=A0A939FCE5_9ACTN|nr:glycoside hydrolase family 6 protein [Streptomyces beijiangensis]MBO0516681.1 glycoside hydrolase family 6 protein [Streptomyces beijiangensis]